MSLAIHEAVEASLTADQSSGSLYDDLSGRIHEGQLPVDSRYPALRYAVTTGTAQVSLQDDRDDHQMQFDLYGHDDDVLSAALGKLRTLLHRQTITDGSRTWRASVMDPGRRIEEMDIKGLRTTYQMREMT